MWWLLNQEIEESDWVGQLGVEIDFIWLQLRIWCDCGGEGSWGTLIRKVESIWSSDESLRGNLGGCS
jgi:hypothetical protein